MKKKAFTLLELIFVTIVIGILAAVVIPRIGTNNLEQAALKTVEALRYTQHLAMSCDRFNPSNQAWYKEKWQVFFTKRSSDEGDYWSMIIFSDKHKHTGKPDPSEIAINPIDPSKKMTGGYTSGAGAIKYEDKRATKSLNLGRTFGIEDVKFSGCGSRAKRVSFDEMGRPYYGDQTTETSPYQRLIQNQCKILLCISNCSTASSNEKITIAIEPRTGYIHIIR